MTGGGRKNGINLAAAFLCGARPVLLLAHSIETDSGHSTNAIEL